MKKEIEVKIPSLPNFILSDDGSMSFGISEFTDDELRKIGELWTEALVLKAQDKRKITNE